MNDALGIHERVGRIYRMYVESAFPLRYPALAAERRALLQKTGVLAQPPLLEPVPTYRSSGKTLAQAAAALPPAYRDLSVLAGPLFPEARTLYQHQWEALEESVSNGKDVVVTTGTGSGKTESFMLPLLASLAADSRDWTPPHPAPEGRMWWRGKGERVSQWGHITRPHALRGIILYPLNALVEDQLRRLRSVLDNPSVVAWFDRERSGNRFTFGRYTSLTPLPGAAEPNKVARLRKHLKEREWEWETVKGSLGGREDGSEYHFPRVDSGELWSRWDAQETPPDLLITNYSMLNIMLMRALEQGMFMQTRDWLAADPGHTFYLVVDELHAYRGTPGTEVSYILRLLIQRLGLHPDSPQLRILATSASLDRGESSKGFLSEFFGRDPDTFRVISSPQKKPERSADLSGLAGAFIAFADASPAGELDSGATSVTEDAQGDLSEALDPAASGDTPNERLTDALRARDIPDALRAACWDEETGVRATGSRELSERLFGEAERKGDALRGALLALATTKLGSGQALQPIRAHLFFQNVQNLWTCTRPGCGCAESLNEPLPQVGKLHDTHRLTCDCGSRILDLLVCEVCGETFLGGHRRKSHNSELLSADRTDLEGIPDQLDSRTYGRYAVLWPVENHDREPETERYDWKGRGRRWQKQYLERSTGELCTLRPREVNPAEHQPIWLYTIASSYQNDNAQESAFPPVCPACDTDYRRREVLPSSIRHHRTGFQKAAQVIASALMREVDVDSRKLVVFSDSRQDAARLAAGMERDHYRDMVRVALLTSLRESSRDLEAAVRFNFQRVAMGSEAALGRLREINAKLAEAAQQALQKEDEANATRFASRSAGAPFLASFLLGAPVPEPQRSELLALLAQYPVRIPLAQLREAVFARLLEQGICPGGNTAGALFYREGNRDQTPWHQAFRWAEDGVSVRNQPEARLHRQRLAELLLAEIMGVLFTHQVRTLESVGQGRVTAPLVEGSVDVQEAADAVVRYLGVKRRYANSEYVEAGESETLPPAVEKFLNQIDLNTDALRKLLKRDGYAEPSMTGLIVRADNLVLIGEGKAQGATSYRCQRCRAHYLHRSAGCCIHCGGTVVPEEAATPQDAERDYYSYLARAAGQSFRLNAEELTGQTDTENRAKRQRHFQEVFLGDENPRAEGVDLLSVTTTMEAGVDIGSLNAVMMSNMPPRRFNYQQRVGRAGRRGAGLSLAVTLCRGRSHDLYYYAHTEAITGDAPPPPYVDTASLNIFQRVLVKEVLRQAIGAQSAVTMDSVHGEFGTALEWRENPERRAALKAFLNDPEKRREIEALARHLATHTDLAEEQRRETLERLQDLPERIDAIACDARYAQEALSERLAYAGLLPMFGFPTRTRVMYLDPLNKIGGQDFPPRNTVDRDLDLAISTFAPGAEVVRDKRVHTSRGVVNLHPSPHGPARVSPGLYPPLPAENPRPLGVCSYCRAIHESESLAGQEGPSVICPTCGKEALRVLDAREPRHFYTTGEPKDYNGFFELRGFSTRPTLAVCEPGAERLVGNARLSSNPDGEPNEILTFNDFNGRGGFFFVPDSLGGAYKTDGSMSPTHRSVRGKLVTLLARRRTDTLQIGLEAWPCHHHAPPEEVEGRAAWYSAAFALRNAASVILDIEAGELEGGLYVTRQAGRAEAHAFLSDRLENGAGYASYLSRPEQFASLLSRLRQELGASWRDRKAHADTCDTSCARCLRDYGNLGFHPLLDWRLALDMAELLHRQTPFSLLGSHWEALYSEEKSPIAVSLRQLGFERTQQPSVLPTFINHHGRTKKAVVLRHPLWTPSHPEVQDALEVLTGTEAKAVSPFMLLRRPSDAL